MFERISIRYETNGNTQNRMRYVTFDVKSLGFMTTSTRAIAKYFSVALGSLCW